MQQIEDQIETLHLYVVREEPKRPYTFLPLFFALLCLTGLAAFTLYSGEHPLYEHKTLTLPAVFLPLQTFTARVVSYPTGVRTYPATKASGILTVTNGSVISQELPAGIILTGNAGIEIVTDTSVFVPAGSANGYGYATVSAHALVSGKSGDIPSYAIDRVEGSSIYIRNLTAFSGGIDAYSVRFATKQDKQTALDTARVSLRTQKARTRAILAHPCKETSHQHTTGLDAIWTCQFIAFPVVQGKITSVHLVGKNLFVDVIFVAQPMQMIAK